MTYNHYFLVLFIGLLVVACQETSLKTSATQNKLSKAAWLLGNWENTTQEGTFKEIWKQLDSKTYDGESFYIIAKDTVFYEKVTLNEKNDSLYYVVSVKNQNEEKPVSFVATKITKHYMVFENKKHDYPKKISYRQVTKDSLYAEISGDNKKQGFGFKKNK